MCRSQEAKGAGLESPTEQLVLPEAEAGTGVGEEEGRVSGMFCGQGTQRGPRGDVRPS